MYGDYRAGPRSQRQAAPLRVQDIITGALGEERMTLWQEAHRKVKTYAAGRMPDWWRRIRDRIKAASRLPNR